MRAFALLVPSMPYLAIGTFAFLGGPVELLASLLAEAVAVH
jgi:hypothetical protein